MDTAILIPARFSSTRFPGKPLTPLNGVPMVRRVYERCRASGLDTYVLTDDERISSLFDEGIAVVSNNNYDNGTSRCLDVFIRQFRYKKYINVQGDMPDITVDIIKKVKDSLDKNHVVTAYCDMSKEEQQDPGVVKIIHNGIFAHWFLRAAVNYGDRHIGVYGYRSTAKFLYPPTPSHLEQVEQLEQLRWLDRKVNVGVVKVEFDGIEINTPQDAERWHQKNLVN
jgi:3-deoxy-manno-octulosonate cytidylyltransferase (CMP-KDO synthetase)